jgi:hypothetical protein
MRITDAWIDDPTLAGVIEPPRLCVEVDELPDVTIPDENFSGGWIVGKYGPFVKYSQTHPVDAGDFNVRFRGRFPSIVDVTLLVKGKSAEYNVYALNLPRARQLLRKWDSKWRLLIGDKEAQNGKIIWNPVESNPVCRKWDGSKICGEKEIAGSARIEGVELPYCREHLRVHNATQAAKRAASSK